MKTFKPQLVAVRNESLVDELKEALADAEYKPEIIPGEEGVIEVSYSLLSTVVVLVITYLKLVILWKFQVARHPDAVTVVTGIVGCAGLKVPAETFLFHKPLFLRFLS